MHLLEQTWSVFFPELSKIQFAYRTGVIKTLQHCERLLCFITLVKYLLQSFCGCSFVYCPLHFMIIHFQGILTVVVQLVTSFIRGRQSEQTRMKDWPISFSLGALPDTTWAQTRGLRITRAQNWTLSYRSLTSFSWQYCENVFHQPTFFQTLLDITAHIKFTWCFGTKRPYVSIFQLTWLPNKHIWTHIVFSDRWRDWAKANKLGLFSDAADL